MTEGQAPRPARHTATRPIRVPAPMWEAYGRVCERLDTDRTNDLLDHMRARIREHGEEQDTLDLEQAERELVERRSRKGGRPRQQTGGGNTGG